MVNLLPWRERKRERSRQRFLAVLAISLLASSAVLALLYRGLEANIAAGSAGNQRLQAEITRLGARGAEAGRMRREQQQTLLHMEVLNSLQRNRSLAAEILAELARGLPDGAYFRQLERSGGEVHIEGDAVSHAAIAELMRKLAASPLFVAADLAGVTEIPADAGAASTGPAGEFAFSLVLVLAEERS